MQHAISGFVRTSAIVLVGSLCAVPVIHADGMLDPSFGNGGLVTTDMGPFEFANDGALSLVVLPDGRAVAAGYNQAFLEIQNMAAARYLVSGALDTTFGNGGLVTFGFPPPPGEFDMVASAESVLLQPDGRLVLVGGVGFQISPARFALARLNPDGSLDPSFGTAGQVTTVFAEASSAHAGLLQGDGRIVAVGNAGFGSSTTIAAARYNADGTLDPSFGNGGQLTLPQFPSFAVHDAALQPDGKILIAGAVGPAVGPWDFALVRLLPNGAPDPAFDGDGLVTTHFSASQIGTSVIALGDGRIVLGGYTVGSKDFALVRYLPDGSVDTTFGNGGVATADSGGPEIADQVIRLPNGKLLVAGYTKEADAGAHDFLLARFGPDGALDTSFGTAGFLRTGFPGGGTDECHAVAVAGPDLVLTAGMAEDVSGFATDFGLARYIASTPVELLTFEVQ